MFCTYAFFLSNSWNAYSRIFIKLSLVRVWGYVGVLFVCRFLMVHFLIVSWKVWKLWWCCWQILTNSFQRILCIPRKHFAKLYVVVFTNKVHIVWWIGSFVTSMFDCASTLAVCGNTVGITVMSTFIHRGLSELFPSWNSEVFLVRLRYRDLFLTRQAYQSSLPTAEDQNIFVCQCYHVLVLWCIRCCRLQRTPVLAFT